MGRNSENMDVRKIRKLLRETTRLAERASMTGSLQGGCRIAIRQYNAIRDHLQDANVIPDGLFQELDEDEATFDELGVVSGLLDSFLEEDEESVPEGEGEPGCEDRESRRARRAKRHGRFEWGAWVGPEAGRFWNDPNTMRDFQRMGEELREHLPDLLKWREHMRGGVPPTPPAPPTPPHQPFSSWQTSTNHQAENPANESAFRGADADPTVRIREIAVALQAEDLDHLRRHELSAELADLVSAMK